MPQALPWIALFVFSIAILLKASDFFTGAAEKIGVSLKIPSFIIGVTIVAFGTSLPELVSSIFAVTRDASEIVAGNVIGSNITNVCLILGITAILARKRISVIKELIDVDLLMLIGSATLLVLMVLDGTLSRFEALLLVAGMILYTLYTVFGERHEEVALEGSVKKDAPQGSIKFKTLFILIVSGLFIYLGAQYTIESVINISKLLNIGTEIIALFAIALGTSLPELTVSISAVKKGQGEMAIGNILGSNIFNIFAVMGISGLITPLPVTERMVTFYLPFMIVISFLYFFIAQDRSFTKWEGWLLMLFYIFFVASLFNTI